MARRRHIPDEEVLAIARDCFLEHGAQVSTAHIAAQVGLSQAALFKRFQTKENLIIEALAPPERDAWFERIPSTPDDRQIEDQLTEIGLDALSFMRTLMPRMMVLKSAGVDPDRIMARYAVPPPVRAHQRLTAWFAAAAQADRIAVDDPSLVAMQFMGGLHVRAYLGHMLQQDHTVGADATYVRSLVRTLWRGVAPVEVP